MQTSYEFYPIENSPVNLDDFDIPDPLGTIILDKTAAEMNEYLDTGAFPPTSDDAGAQNNQNRSRNLNEGVQRRTPSGNGAPARRAF